MSIKDNFKKRRVPIIVLGSAAIVLAAAGIAAKVVSNAYDSILQNAFSTSTVNKEKHKEVYEKGAKLNQEIEEEGIVLLKNKNDNSLPLAKNSKVNCFGVRSASLVLNGSGSASSTTEGAVSLKKGLEHAGFEVNEPLWNLLASNKIKDTTSVREGVVSEAVNELEVAKYQGEASFEKAKQFSEIAIVTFGRIGGEGSDLARGGMGVAKNKTYLELCDGEINLLNTLKEKGFKIVVLLNSSYPMQSKFLEDDSIIGALWIGGPGFYGSYGIGTILSGDKTPSGHLPDTWAYDHRTSSTFKTTERTSLTNNGKAIFGYTDFSEGIYMGYRWYETADAEGYWDQQMTKMIYGISNGYQDVVQFPFGYGLSYTTFERHISAMNESNGVLEFEITSKNTGSTRSGKDVLQLYVEKPYTEGGIEKSKIEFIGFDKTELLEPGATSKKHTIKVNVEDLASYDVTANANNGAYVLDAGTYKFYLSDDSHSYATISATSDLYKEYTVTSALTYSGANKRKSDNVEATNQLSTTNIKLGNKIEVLSRKGRFSNAASTITSTKQNVEVEATTSTFKNLTQNAKAKSQGYTGEILSNLKMGVSSKLNLMDMIKEDGTVDIDDPRWEELIAKMSYDDLNQLIGKCGWSTPEIKSINKYFQTEIDGPFGLNNYVKNQAGTSADYMSYCSEAVTAATFNKDLADQLGKLLADEANATNVAAMYAPGVNLHRSNYGGRNPEYFSEDPYLSGMMAAYEMSAASEKGLYMYMKHFAFNDIEANRTNQVCYFDEQTARELYLRAFEIPMKFKFYEPTGYNASGMMVSYMWAGEETWCGSNTGLIRNIVKGEWNFKGVSITDNALKDFMKIDCCLRSGIDLVLINSYAPSDSSWAKTPENVSALKTAAKNYLYVLVDHSSRRETKLIKQEDPWHEVYVPLINGGIFGLSGAALVGAALLLVLKKKESLAKQA